MSQTPTPSELIEIRRVKAMVAGSGATINPQCFLGPQGPPGATGPPGPAVTLSTLTVNNGSVLYYDSSTGITGNSLFTFTSTINSLGQVIIQGELDVGNMQTNYAQLIGQASNPLVSSGIVWYNKNTQSLFVDSQNYSPIVSLQSSIIGLGSTGYISSLNNITFISSLQGDFGTVNADIVNTSTVNTSLLITSTLITNNINVQSGTFSSINVNTIFASTICTFTAVVYGFSTLVVEGLLYSQTLNLPNDLDSQFRQITVNNGNLAIDNNNLAHTDSVFNTMFSLVYCNSYISNPANNPVGTFESDTNTFVVSPTVPDNNNYFIQSGQSFQCATLSGSLTKTDTRLSQPSLPDSNGIFGIIASCNYIPPSAYERGHYLYNQPLLYYTTYFSTTRDLSPAMKILSVCSPAVGAQFQFPFTVISNSFTKLYDPTDVLGITVESILPQTSYYSLNAGFVRYSFLVNGSNCYSNVMNIGYSNYIIPEQQIPYFTMLLSNFRANDVYANMIFTGVDTWIATDENIVNTSIQPGLFSNQVINATSSLIGSYEFISTASMNNSLFTLTWPQIQTGSLKYNPATNTLSAIGNVVFNDANGKITSLESYPNVYFSCVANINGDSTKKQGLIDSTGIFRYYFTYDTTYLLFNILDKDGNTTTQNIKIKNPNDLLSISLTSQYTTVGLINSYSIKFIATVNGKDIFNGYSYEFYNQDVPPFFKAAFQGTMNDNESYANIVFSGCYGYSYYSNTGSPDAVTSLAAYPYQFNQTLSNIEFIDNSNTFSSINYNYSISQLSNYNSNLYLDGNLVGTAPYIAGVFNSTFSTLETSYSKNNAMFSFTIPTSIPVGAIVFNSANNSLNCRITDGSYIATVEAYTNVFFSCKANILGGPFTKFGIVDSNNSFYQYFYRQGDSLKINDGGSYTKSWNSNDVLAITITQYPLTNLLNNIVNYYVNDSIVYTTTANYYGLYRGGFNYFNQGDIYTNIVFSGSYGIMSNSNTSVFVASYPFTQMPIYSSIKLIDTENSSNNLELINYQSTLYFGGTQLIIPKNVNSTVQGLGNLGYISTNAELPGSFNNAMFSLRVPDNLDGSVVANSGDNSLYATANILYDEPVTSVEYYTNVFFSCVADINGGGASKFGIINPDNIMMYYFGNGGGTLVINGSITVKAWRSTDKLAITITNYGYTKSINYYVNGQDVYNFKTNDGVYSYRAAFSYFVQGDIYTNIVFSGSYQTMTGSNTSVFLTSYPQVTTYNNGIFTLITPSDAPPGTFIYNSALNSLYIANYYNTTSNIISLESYNNVFFSCVANLQDSNGNTKFGLIDGGGDFVNYFMNTNNGYLQYFVNGQSNQVHLWNSTDILSISLTNQGPTQTVTFYLNGSTLAAPYTTYTYSPVYSAAFSPSYLAGDYYSDIVFSGSAGILANSNDFIFLAAYPPLLNTIKNNGMFTLITPNNASPGTFIYNSATNSLYASNTYNGNSNITTLESYNNVFFSCVANVQDTNGNTKFGLVDTQRNFCNYFTNSNGGYLCYNVNGSGTQVHLWNSNDILGISLTNQGLTQTVTFYLNGSTLAAPYQTSISEPLYRAAFGSYFTAGDSYSNIVFSGSYGKSAKSSDSVFVTSYSPSPMFLVSPTPVTNVNFQNTDTDVGLSLRFMRKNITTFSGAVTFNVTSTETVNNTITLSLYSNASLYKPIAYTTILPATYNCNYFTLSYSYIDSNSTGEINWSLFINNSNGSSTYTTLSTLTNMMAITM